MAANAFTLFGTLNIDSKRFQSALREADKNLKTTASSLDAFEKRLTTTGNLASHIAQQLDKVASALNRIKSAAGGVKGLTITLQGVGGAATSTANSVSKVGTASKQASVDTSQLQGTLDRLEGEFTSIKNAISEYGGRLSSAGKMNETAKRSIEKLQQSLQNQRTALQKAIDAYTSGTMSAKQFVATVDRISNAMAKLSGKVADATAKVKDSVAADRASAQAKRQAAAAAEAKRAALAKERAANQAARDAARQAAAASRQQAADMRLAAAAARAKASDVGSLGKKLSSAGAAVKGFGTDLTYLVSVPMAGLAAYSFNAATGLDAIINKLTAATGSTSQASEKFSHFMELAKTSPGVFAKAGASLFAAFKPMGLSDTAIDEVVKAFGRLKTAEENFDFDQFRLNMAQMFGQKFEMQDMKQALTFFPRFAELLSKQMGLATTDLDSLQKHLKAMQDSGVLTFENFATAIADSVNKDKNFGLLEETLGNRFKKMAEQVEIAIAPLGSAIADRIEPSLAKLVGHIENLSKKFQKLPKATQDSILKFGGLAAIIGPVIVAIGSLAGVLGFIVKGIQLLYAPIARAGGIMATWGKIVGGVSKAATAVFSLAGLKITAIILALIAVAYLAYKSFQENWGYIGDIVMDVYSRISSTLQGAINEIAKFWHFNKGAIKEAIANIMTVAAVIINILSPVWYILGGAVMAAWDVISVALKGIWQVVSSVVMLIVHIIRGDFKAAFYELGNVVIGVVNIFLGFAGAINRVVTGFVKAIGVIEQTLTGTGFFNWLGDEMEEATNTMVDGIPMLESSAYDLSSSIGEGFKIGADDAAAEIKTSVSQLMSGTTQAMNIHHQWLRETMYRITATLESEFAEQKKTWKYGTEEYRKEMENYGKVVEQLHAYATQGLQAGSEAELAGALKAYREVLEAELAKPLNVGPMRDKLKQELEYLNYVIDTESQDLQSRLQNMGIFTMPMREAKNVSNQWHNLGTEARAGLILGINPTSSFTPGMLLGQNLAAGFSAGIAGLTSKTDEKKNDVVKPPPGAKAGGRKTAQDFFEGFVEGLDMLKASPNASLAGLFDVKKMRGLLKGKSGQMVVDFLKPIVDEAAKLKEGATYFDLFNQRVAKLRETASPQLKTLLNEIGESLKEMQSEKDKGQALKDAAEGLERLKEKLKDFQGQLAGEKSVQQALEDFIGDPANKFDLTSDAVQRLIAQLRGAAKELDIKKANEGVAEIMKEVNANIAEFQQAQADATKELQGFIDLGKPAQTNLQQLETFFVNAALKGFVFSDAMKAAARASATAADSVAKIEGNLSTLGINLQASVNQFDLLKATLADSAGLDALAAKLKMSVGELKKIIVESYNAKAAIGEFVSFEGGSLEKLTQMEQVIAGIRQKMQALAAETPTFADAISNSLASFVTGFGDIFAEAVQNWDGTLKGFMNSLATGFRSLIKQIISELMRLIAIQAALKIFDAMGLGSMLGGASSSGSLPFAGGTNPFDLRNAIPGGFRASGGLIRGKGNGTSDSILTALSNGEYVIPAKSVKKFGVGFFDQLKSGRMPAMPQAMPSASSVSNSSSVSNMTNTFNINVPQGQSGQKTGTMVQREILTALKRTERRNR